MRQPYSVHITPRSRFEIERFLATEMGALERLSTILESLRATPDVEDLADACSEQTGIAVEDVEAALVIAINLSRLQRTLSVSATEATAALCESLPMAFGDRWTPDLSGALADRSRILEQMIVEDGVIQVMSKVRRLLFDHQAVLADTSVVTDVRHVYNSAGEAIVGGLVLHNIGLRFIEGDDTQEIHVTLSSQALRTLLRQLERALQKEATATNFLERAGVPELTPKRDDTL